jgi:hypothetical protein
MTPVSPRLSSARQPFVTPELIDHHRRVAHEPRNAEIRRVFGAVLSHIHYTASCTEIPPQAEEREAALRLDHLTIIAPDLEAGADHVRDTLGIDMPFGGRHPEMRTHNLLARLGDDLFLEVIAVDPDAEAPGRPRWFGLDDAAAVRREWDAGHRLRGWVAQTQEIAGVLSVHGAILGESTQVSRGDRAWRVSVPADGSLPADGTAPSVIDWGARGTPAPAMAEHGLSLVEFWIEHQRPRTVESLYKRLGLDAPPLVREAERFRYGAVIRTPTGLRTLY